MAKKGVSNRTILIIVGITIGALVVGLLFFGASPSLVPPAPATPTAEIASAPPQNPVTQIKGKVKPPVVPTPIPTPVPTPPPVKPIPRIEEVARIVFDDCDDLINQMSHERGYHYHDADEMFFGGGISLSERAVLSYTDDQINNNLAMPLGQLVTRKFFDDHVDMAYELYTQHGDRPFGPTAAGYNFRNPEGIDILVMSAINGHAFVHVRNFIAHAALLNKTRFRWSEVVNIPTIILKWIPTTWNVWHEYVYKDGFVYASQESGIVVIAMEAFDVRVASAINVVSDRTLTRTRWGWQVYSLPIRGAHYIDVDVDRPYIYVMGAVVNAAKPRENEIVDAHHMYAVTIGCPEQRNAKRDVTEDMPSIPPRVGGKAKRHLELGKSSAEAVTHTGGRALMAFEITLDNAANGVVNIVTEFTNLTKSPELDLGAKRAALHGGPHPPAGPLPPPGPPAVGAMPRLTHISTFGRTYVHGTYPERRTLQSGEVIDILWLASIYNNIFYALNVTDIRAMGEESSILKWTCLPTDASYWPHTILISPDHTTLYLQSEDPGNPMFMYDVRNLQPKGPYPLLNTMTAGPSKNDMAFFHEGRIEYNKLKSNSTTLVDRIWMSAYSQGVFLFEISKTVGQAPYPKIIASLDYTTRYDPFTGLTVDGCRNYGIYCGAWAVHPLEGNDNLAVGTVMGPYGKNFANHGTDAGTEEPGLVVLRAVTH